METIERLKDIINNSYKRLTAEDKAFVYATADELGIIYDKKATCKSCVIDVAVMCVDEMRKDEKSEGTGLRLKPGIDILVNGTRINSATCSTVEECENALKLGTPRHYFDFD